MKATERLPSGGCRCIANERRRQPSTISLLALLLATTESRSSVAAFVPTARRGARGSGIRRPLGSLGLRGAVDDGEVSEASVDPREELSLPIVRLTKQSILFDEPATDEPTSPIDEAIAARTGSITFALWSGAKTVFPPIVTGARKANAGDADALGSLYNLLFVRLPTIAVGAGYLYNLSRGHPLMMDPFGTGPFAVSPALVAGALWAILRY